ncbi:MAG: dTDP-4-dehydrorhamnose reductase [Flavisolibacter sp.]
MNEKSTILVTGSNGQLGSELRELAHSYPQFNFIFLTREELSITDRTAVDHILEMYQPHFVVNCAAYTTVDKAETELELANDINGNAVGHLAFACQKYGAGFIHISTDYVFNGKKSGPWKEDDEVDPVNAYGASKLIGEYKAQKNNPDSIIIRTSWVYSFYGRNFVKTMMRLMNEKESIGVVSDQLGSPTYAADLADAIMKIITSAVWKPGIYHYCNSGAISWFEFSKAIREITHSTCIVNPITTEQFPTPAVRPAYSVMDTHKIQEAYSITIQPWRESLEKCIEKLKAGS